MGQTKHFSIIFDGDDKVRLVSPTVTTNLTNEEVEHLDDEKILWQIEHSTKSPFISTTNLQRKQQCFTSSIEDKTELMLTWRSCLTSLSPSSEISNLSSDIGVTIVCSVDLIRRSDWNLETLIFVNEKALSSFTSLTKEANTVSWISPVLSHNLAILNVNIGFVVEDSIGIKL